MTSASHRRRVSQIPNAGQNSAHLVFKRVSNAKTCCRTEHAATRIRPCLFEECRIRSDDVIIADQPCMAGKSDYYSKTPIGTATCDSVASTGVASRWRLSKISHLSLLDNPNSEMRLASGATTFSFTPKSCNQVVFPLRVKVVRLIVINGVRERISVVLLIIWHIVVRIIWHTIVPDVPSPTPKRSLTKGISWGRTFSPLICCRYAK